MAAVVMSGKYWWCLVVVVRIFLIQDFILARPVIPTTQPGSAMDPDGSLLLTTQGFLSPSWPSPSSPPPSTSASSSSTTTASSDSPTNHRPLDMPSSMLKAILFKVLDEEIQNDFIAKNRSSSSRDSLADANKSPTINKDLALPGSPDNADNTSTLTLVAVIALVVAIFIVGLFAAVICPCKIHPKSLFQNCQCPPSCLRHSSSHRHTPRQNNNNNNCYHNDGNNSTATIINESISSSSATSTQNFNLNDNNGCDCLQHGSLPTTYGLVRDFPFNDNSVIYTKGRQIYPIRCQSNFYYHYQPQASSEEAKSLTTENGINDITMTKQSNSRSCIRGSIKSDCSNSRVHESTPNQPPTRQVSRCNSRSSISIGNQANNNSYHQQDAATPLENNLSGFYHVVGKRHSRGSLQSLGNDYRKVAGTHCDGKTVRTTPRANHSDVSRCANVNDINNTNAHRNSNGGSQLQPRCCALPLTGSRINNNNIVSFPIESHSGGSHENANVDRETDSSESSTSCLPLAPGIRDKRRHGDSHFREMSDIPAEHPESDSCPYCEVDDRVGVERTWVDQNNRQHSAL